MSRTGLLRQSGVLQPLLRRRLREFFTSNQVFASATSDALPMLAFKHKTPIRRALLGVTQDLIEAKATNLRVVAPIIDGVLIRPGETFSFWRLVGKPSKRRGFVSGPTLNGLLVEPKLGGGLCQLTNLLHWLVLHSPLEISEQHHRMFGDRFPDQYRQVPFGIGTTVVHNQQDYRVKNPTSVTFQFRCRILDEHLCAELRVSHPLDHSYTIREERSFFYETITDDGSLNVRRHNSIYREVTDQQTGALICDELLLEVDTPTLYDRSYIVQPIHPSLQAATVAA